MSDKILRVLEAAGGHAHMSQLTQLTDMTPDTLDNYLQLLKKDNKVVFHTSAWHLKVFNDRPASKGTRTADKVLECLDTKRTIQDLQCLLPSVKEVQLQETIDSLEKEGKVKRFVCYKATYPVSKSANSSTPKPYASKNPQKQPRPQKQIVEPQFACQDIRYMDKPTEDQLNMNNTNSYDNHTSQRKQRQNFSNNHNNNFANNNTRYPNNNTRYPNNNNNNHGNFANNSGNFGNYNNAHLGKPGNQQHYQDPSRQRPSNKMNGYPPHDQNPPTRPRMPPPSFGDTQQHQQHNIQQHQQHNMQQHQQHNMQQHQQHNMQQHQQHNKQQHQQHNMQQHQQHNMQQHQQHNKQHNDSNAPFSTYQNFSRNSTLRMPLSEDTRPPTPPNSGTPRPLQRPPIRLTGIDPYTNRAYGCSKLGYNQQPGGHGMNQGIRQSGPTYRDGRNTIRQPVTMRVQNEPVIRQKNNNKVAVGGSKGRGKSRNNSHVNDPNAILKVSNDGRTKSITTKDPNEGKILAEMRKDSQTERKILKKANSENTHVEITSDGSDSSDDIAGIDPAVLTSALEKMTFGDKEETELANQITEETSDKKSHTAVQLPVPDINVQPESSLSLQKAMETLPAAPNKPSETFTVSPQKPVEILQVSPQKPIESLPVSSQKPVETLPISPQVSMGSVPISPTKSVSSISGASPIDVSNPPQLATLPKPSVSAVNLELSQIASELSNAAESAPSPNKSTLCASVANYNFGLSDSDDDDEELAPLADMLQTEDKMLPTDQ